MTARLVAQKGGSCQHCTLTNIFRWQVYGPKDPRSGTRGMPTSADWVRLTCRQRRPWEADADTALCGRIFAVLAWRKRIGYTPANNQNGTRTPE